MILLKSSLVMKILFKSILQNFTFNSKYLEDIYVNSDIFDLIHDEINNKMSINEESINFFIHFVDDKISQDSN